MEPTTPCQPQQRKSEQPHGHKRHSQWGWIVFKHNPRLLTLQNNVIALSSDRFKTCPEWQRRFKLNQSHCHHWEDTHRKEQKQRPCSFPPLPAAHTGDDSRTCCSLRTCCTQTHQAHIILGRRESSQQKWCQWNWERHLMRPQSFNTKYPSTK